jgi:FHS family L-fucose permease-like MFS transporter
MSKAASTLVTAVFFAWGFLSSLNSVLVPHFKQVFALGYGGSALVPLAFFSAYLFLSLPFGATVERIGYQRSIVVGLAISTLGALLFYPAASLPSYPLFLAGLFVLAAGITLLQVAANPYVAALGPPETAASRLNFVQAFNALGTTVAPYLGGWWFLSVTPRSDGDAAARAVRGPYLVIAAVLAALAAALWFARLPAIAAGEPKGSFLAALRVRRLWLGMIAGFVYVGAEVTTGSFLVDLLALPNVAGLSAGAAAPYVSMYWGGGMIGRILGAAALRGRDAGKALGACGVAAAVLVTAAATSRGLSAAMPLVAVGLCNSIMFPTIFSLAIADLGELRSRGSSLLVMTIVGGAVLPALVGAAADRVGLQNALAAMIPCYLYVAWYGARGSRLDRLDRGSG